MARLFLLTLLLSCLKSAGQQPPDISGRWGGNYYDGLNLLPPKKLTVDIPLSADTQVTGTSHLQHRNGQYEHYTIRGVWRAADSSIVFDEDSVIGVNVITGSTCTGRYSMRLRLVAESEGTTPPCTAHLVVTTRAGKSYALALSSSSGVNGALELFFTD